MIRVETITDRMTKTVVCIEGHGVGLYVRLHGDDERAAVRGAVDLHKGLEHYAAGADFETSKIEAGRKVFVGGASRACWRLP
jgi:hypothetical protein